MSLYCLAQGLNLQLYTTEFTNPYYNSPGFCNEGINQTVNKIEEVIHKRGGKNRCFQFQMIYPSLPVIHNKFSYMAIALLVNIPVVIIFLIISSSIRNRYPSCSSRSIVSLCVDAFTISVDMSLSGKRSMDVYLFFFFRCT